MSEVLPQKLQGGGPISELHQKSLQMGPGQKYLLN
jgi:hypothetical protein